VTPIEDEGLKAELLDVLERCFAENANAWELSADGIWTRHSPPGGERRSVQEEFRRRHSARAAEQLAAAG